MLRKMFWAVVFAAVQCAAVSAESDCNQFRGSEGQGVSLAVDLPIEWSEQQSIAWKTPIVGEGWSSPVFADDVVWVTSATRIEASEADRLAIAADSPIAEALELASKISLWLTKLDVVTGQVIEQIKLADVDDPQRIHSLNGYASPTPVIGGECIFCHFGDFGTFCVNRSTSEIVWQRRIQLDHSVGPGSSPVLVEGLLVLTCDGMEQQYVTALEASNGQIAWRTDRPPLAASNAEFRKAFSTPLVIRSDGVNQIVVPGAQWFVAYEPKTGNEIWRVDHGRGFSNVPRPIFDGGLVYMCTGFATEQLWAVAPDGEGDVTDSHVRWRATKQVPTTPSPVVFGERIYTISDAGIAQCINAADGELVWKKRIGGNFSASPLLADRRIYLSSHEGVTTVLAAGDSYRELAQNKLDGQLMASPVVVEDDLLLRTDTHLYRIGD